jgi:hypothetical protein
MSGMAPNYILTTHRWGHWIIVQPDNPRMAWSGSRWVPIDGDVQICNFESVGLAIEYAQRYLDEKPAAVQP